jgi:hypothetical protein
MVTGRLRCRRRRAAPRWRDRPCCRGTKRVTETTPPGPDVQVGIRGDQHANDVICRCIWSIGEISQSAADGLDGLSDPAATIG